jgi:transcription initiation factor IIF auxiliary subunit
MKIAQDQKYKGKDWWEWGVWIDAPPTQLDQIKKVIWRLHPTFPNPVRAVTSRKDAFKLATAGWGTFRVYAEVVMASGDHVKLQHDLELSYPDGGSAPV